MCFVVTAVFTACEAMASLPAGGMKSLGEFLGLDGHQPTKLHETFKAVEPRKLCPTLAKPRVLEMRADAPEVVDVPDLNIKYISVTTGKHILDLIPDFDGPVDLPAIRESMLQNQYNLLPVPFKPKHSIDALFNMQVNIHEKDNKWRIVKWFMFEEKQTFDASFKQSLIYGTACQPCWTSPSYTYHVLKVLQALLERLPGTTMSYRRWADEGGSTDRHDDFDLAKNQEGYAFIEKFGPRANNNNQFNIWTDEWIHRSDSKIFGWPEKKVKSSLENYAKLTSGARTIERWPITLRKTYPEIMNKVVVPAYSTHETHGVLLVGRTRAGKSTLGKASGMAISGKEIKKAGLTDVRPSVTVANRVDFWRLEPGSKAKPAIADEINLQKVSPEDLKMLSNPSDEDPLMWARWGGTQMEPNQSRQILVNPFNKELERTFRSQWPDREEILFSEFAKLIEVNWPKDANEEDIEAYYSRLNIVLLSDAWIYTRWVWNGKKNVPRIAYPDPSRPDLFIPEATEIGKKFKKDRMWLPASYQEDFAWDVALMEKLAKGETIPHSITISGPSLWSDVTVKTYAHPVLSSGSASSGSSHDVPCGDEADQRELQAVLRRKTIEAGMDGTVIDVTTRPRKSLRVDLLDDEDVFGCGFDLD